MKRNGWRVPIVVCIAAFCVVAAAMLCVLAGQYVFSGRLASGLDRLYAADHTLPVSVTVFGRGTGAGIRQDTISARIAFYAPDGALAGSFERSWPGWELQLDCILMGNASGWLVFPWIVFTDETTSGHGVNLARYYSRDGFPAIYDSPLLSAAERERMKTLFLLVRSESMIPPFLGSLRHEVLKVRNYVPGTEYFLRVARDGSIELSQ
jgi:hypothetical protein